MSCCPIAVVRKVIVQIDQEVVEVSNVKLVNTRLNGGHRPVHLSLLPNVLAFYGERKREERQMVGRSNGQLDRLIVHEHGVGSFERSQSCQSLSSELSICR